MDKYKDIEKKLKKKILSLNDQELFELFIKYNTYMDTRMGILERQIIVIEKKVGLTK